MNDQSVENQAQPDGLQAAVFDFGGVISKTLFETHRQSERALGLPTNSLTWRGPFDPDSDPLWQQMQAGDISERDYWLERARLTGLLVNEQWTSMQQLVRRVRGQSPQSVIRPEALASFERLKNNGIRLAILSNELQLFYGKAFVDKLDFLDQFDCIVDASFSDILKPDPRAYHACLDQLTLNSEQCVFVDDQPKNIQGAQAVGLTTVNFDVCAPLSSYNQLLKLFKLDPLPSPNN